MRALVENYILLFFVNGNPAPGMARGSSRILKYGLTAINQLNPIPQRF